jgi:hypothetical protein
MVAERSKHRAEGFRARVARVLLVRDSIVVKSSRRAGGKGTWMLA